jgi:hypothetical protein
LGSYHAVPICRPTGWRDGSSDTLRSQRRDSVCAFAECCGRRCEVFHPPERKRCCRHPARKGRGRLGKAKRPVVRRRCAVRGVDPCGCVGALNSSSSPLSEGVCRETTMIGRDRPALCSRQVHCAPQGAGQTPLRDPTSSRARKRVKTSSERFQAPSGERNPDSPGLGGPIGIDRGQAVAGEGGSLKKTAGESSVSWHSRPYLALARGM